jgi:hypothetical protein
MAGVDRAHWVTNDSLGDDMTITSRPLLPLVASLLVLQACGTVDQRYPDSQPAAAVDTITPVAAPHTPTAAPVAQVIPVAPSAPALAPVTEASPAGTMPTPVDTSKAPTMVDRYTVMPGDTLVGIAAKNEIYGDSRLWPLLYRANVQQIGPQGLIFPKQVLVVSRNHSPDEVAALIARPRKPMTLAKPVVPTSAPVANAPSAPGPSAEGMASETMPVEAKAAATPVPVAKPTESPTAAQPAGNAPKGTPGAAGQPGQLADYLAGGRRAFAAGDVPWAVYYYSVYLEQKYDDANAWGELGNVHYFDGNFADAAKAYYNAANLLIDRGQTARAMSLIPAIEEGDPGLSEALHQRLTTIKR